MKDESATIPAPEVPLREQVKEILGGLREEDLCLEVVQGYLRSARADAATLEEALRQPPVNFRETRLMAERLQISMGRYLRAVEQWKRRAH